MNCYVIWNGGAYMVKEQKFFEAQKANSLRDHPDDKWWTHWRLVYGVDGIEHARDKARMLWGVNGERW
jgi:hypothetical protein